MNNDKIQLSITANSAKALLMLATQQIDVLTSENVRLKYRVQELTDQCNEINNKLHAQEQHLNVGPSYEDMENALLTEQEHNGNLTKEVDRLTAILKERDAEIELKIQMLNIEHEEVAHLREELARQKRLYDDLNDILQQTKAKLPKKKKVEEPTDCIKYSEGDQIIITGAFWGDNIPDHHATILEVMKDGCDVVITEKDSDFEDDEPWVPFDYIRKE